MTVRIRMHPMYADFIKFDFETTESGQVFATERKPIGLLIKNLLSRQPELPAKREYDKDAYVEFILPDYTDINNMYRNYISMNAERLIAQKIRNQFYYELHDFIIETFGAGLDEYRAAIITFCEQFEIDEKHYKVNSLEKQYRRYRSRQKTVQKTQKIASALLLCFSFVCPMLVPFIQLFK